MALVEFYQKYTSLRRFVVAVTFLLFVACGTLDNSDLAGDADSKELRDSKKVSEIHFVDETLKTCILSEDIEYVFELQTLTCDGGIQDLTGLEHFTGLVHLNLNGNDIKDISPLENLTKLTQLHIAFNSQITDISAISYMEHLTIFDSELTSVADISPLIHVENINMLVLEGNNISDLTPLINLQKMESINLAGNGLSDASFLNNLPKLKWLYLHENNISVIPDFVSLNYLEFLSLGKNPLSSVCPLTELKDSLIGLDLTYCDITSDVSCLKDMHMISTGPGLKIDFTGNNSIPCSSFTTLLSGVLTEDHIIRPSTCPAPP